MTAARKKAPGNTKTVVVIAFSVIDKANQVRFFEKTFLVANISPEIVFGMLFFILSSADVDFLDWEFWWRIYITQKAFLTTRHIEPVKKKELVAVVPDPDYETFIVYVAFLSFTPLDANVNPAHRPQITGLIAKKAPTKVHAEYTNFAKIFSLDLAFELPKHIGINDYTIKLVNGQQPLYGPIYSLRPIKVQTLKAYIETNLANRFIKQSKSLIGTPIILNWKLDKFFLLCIDYRCLNNLTIKNRYPLLLVGELLDRWKRARRFIQLDFISIYHQMRICKGDK